MLFVDGKGEIQTADEISSGPWAGFGQKWPDQSRGLRSGQEAFIMFMTMQLPLPQIQLPEWHYLLNEYKYDGYIT